MYSRRSSLVIFKQDGVDKHQHLATLAPRVFAGATMLTITDGQKFRQFRTHLHHILVSTVQICKPMIQNNVEKFRPIHGLSFTQQSNFDMLNNFLRNQLKKAASVPDFSSTSVKNGLFEKILLQN